MGRAALPDWPRLMLRSTAAAYCDLSEAAFEREVADERLPLPTKIGGRDHWCRVQIDEAIGQLTGGSHNWEKEQPGLAA